MSSLVLIRTWKPCSLSAASKLIHAYRQVIDLLAGLAGALRPGPAAFSLLTECS